MKELIKVIDRNILFNILSYFYKKILFYKSKKFLKYYPNYFIHSKQSLKNPIDVLCEKYGSDKGGLKYKLNGRKNHFYSSYYYELFKDKKEKIKLIFECGIGTTDENIQANMTKYGKPGASLRVFRDYFLNAKIYGADIDKNILFTSDRIFTYYVDQLDKASILSMWNNIKKDCFDIIIDDGMHDLEASFNLFKFSFLKLRKGGIYIIEDVNVSYLVQLAKKLNKFNPKIISSSKKNNIDDYLFVIEKF